MMDTIGFLEHYEGMLTALGVSKEAASALTTLFNTAANKELLIVRRDKVRNSRQQGIDRGRKML
jgi:hypothetical protein